MKGQEKPRKSLGGQEAAGSSKRGTPVSELGRMCVCMYEYDVCTYVYIFSISDFSESE